MDKTANNSADLDDEWCSQADEEYDNVSSEIEEIITMTNDDQTKTGASHSRQVSKSKKSAKSVKVKLLPRSPKNARVTKTARKRKKADSSDNEMDESQHARALPQDFSNQLAHVIRQVTININTNIDKKLAEVSSKIENTLAAQIHNIVDSKVDEKLSVEFRQLNEQVDAKIDALTSQFDLCKEESAQTRQAIDATASGTNITALESQIRDLQDTAKKQQSEIELLTAKYDEKLENLEKHGRKLNLIFEGIPEREGESCKHIVHTIINRDMRLQLNDSVDIAHRLPNGNARRPPSIIARFKTVSAKSTVLYNKDALRHTHITVRPDLPSSFVQRRNYVAKSLHSAKAVDPHAKIIKDKLIYKKQTYSVHNIHRANIPDSNHTVESDSQVKFYGYLSPYSNFHATPFKLNGQQYSCVEQAYQSNKARKLNDYKTSQDIMKAVNPAHMKQLGRPHKNSLDRKTDIELLEEAVTAKFSQNERLKRLLLGTNNKKMYECNPYDSFFGTGGYLLDNITSTTKGKNEMGAILERVRNKLR